MAATYEITDQTTHSLVILKESGIIVKWWSIPKTVSTRVEDGYLIISGPEILKLPRAFITVPASTDDADLAAQIAFMAAPTSSSVDAYDVTYPPSTVGNALDSLFALNNQPYAVNQWHSFTENYDATAIRSLDANMLLGYQIFIRKSVNISQIAARFIAGGAGSMVAGLYTSQGNGNPGNKLIQSGTPYNNAVTGVQQSAVLGGTAIVPAGLYWCLYLSNSTPTIAALTQQTFINRSGFNAAMTTPNNIWFRGLAYNATMPTSAGSGTLANYGNGIPFFTFLTPP